MLCCKFKRRPWKMYRFPQSIDPLTSESPRRGSQFLTLSKMIPHIPARFFNTSPQARDIDHTHFTDEEAEAQRNELPEKQPIRLPTLTLLSLLSKLAMWAQSRGKVEFILVWSRFPRSSASPDHSPPAQHPPHVHHTSQFTLEPLAFSAGDFL